MTVVSKVFLADQVIPIPPTPIPKTRKMKPLKQSGYVINFYGHLCQCYITGRKKYWKSLEKSATHTNATLI